MNEMQQTMEIRDIERRIQNYKEDAVMSILGIGRCLIAAKDAGLVPIGSWQDWVQEQTGWSIRQAERVMNAARQVNAGSALARLSFSKIQEILRLPEGEREALAERTEAESLTVQQLRKEVDHSKQAMEDVRANAQRTEALLRRGMQEKDKALEKLQSARDDAERRVADAEEKLGIQRRQMEDMRNALAEAKNGASRHDPAMTAKIEKLEDTIRDMEREIEDQALRRQKAEQELLDMMQAGNPGAPMESTVSAARLGALVTEFLAEAGVMTQMGLEISRMNDAERRQLRMYADMILAWYDGMLNTMNTIVID